MGSDATAYHPSVLVRRDGPVATVTLNRPAAKNACTGDMWVAIGRTFSDLGHSDARVVVLTGAGGDFCAGADLSGGDDDARFPPQGTILDGMRVLADAALAVHGCPVPVVAKVDGVCVGAGLGLALHADLIWCSDRARFSAIFAKRGLSPDFGTSWLLPRRVGLPAAKLLAYTGRMVPAEHARTMGLVDAVVPVDTLDAATDELAAEIADGPPIALASTKRLLDHADASSLAQALEAEALAQSWNAQTEDMREALTAFVERRSPRFMGR
jgi:2-(1,2-epoxy-1,2-dihydrophenyl)acetyl-CoA isomerase